MSIKKVFASVDEKNENGQLKDALDEIFELVRVGNKYYDYEQPWKTRTSDPGKCGDTLFNCVQLIANLAVLLAPFLPFSSNQIFEWLNLSSEWKIQSVPVGYALPDTSILFERLDKSVIDNEIAKFINI